MLLLIFIQTTIGAIPSSQIGKEPATVIIDGFTWRVIKRDTYGANNRPCALIVSDHILRQNAVWCDPDVQSIDYSDPVCLLRSTMDSIFSQNFKQLKQIAIKPIFPLTDIDASK
jgi:hypothetical protein